MRVRDVDPEQLLLMPCGFDAAQTRAEWARTPQPDWFAELRAVRDGRGLRRWTVRPTSAGPGRASSTAIALLAELLDPQGFAGFAPPGSWLPVGEPAEPATD